MRRTILMVPLVVAAATVVSPQLGLPGTCIALFGCSESGASGTYVAKFLNGVDMLQLVEMPDHQITGQLQAVIVVGEGKVENDSYEVTGGVNGSNLSLSLKPTSLFSVAVTESGTIDSNKLTLIGELSSPQPSTVVFVRSNSSEFLTLSKLLNDTATLIRAANEKAQAQKEEAQREAQAAEEETQREKNLVTGLDQLAQRMERFHTAAAKLLTKLPSVEQRYREITAKMATNYNRERGLTGNPNATVARSQIAGAINQGLMTTNEIHNDLQSTQSDFQTNIIPLANQVSASAQTCQATHTSTPDNPVPPKDEERNSACLQILNADGPFRTSYNALAQQLGELETIYQQEQQTQQRLVTAAFQGE